MKNNIYEAPKALLYTVNVCDVITTSGGGAIGPLFDNEAADILVNGWLSAGDLAD